MSDRLLEQTFWSKIILGNTENDCLEWIGAKTERGYGNIARNGTSLKAHRVAYELLVGKIPEGLVIDHLCRNHSCVNPDHLEPVTQRENCLRGNARNNGQHMRDKTHCPKGHIYSGTNSFGGRICKICSILANRKSRLKKKSKGLLYV